MRMQRLIIINGEEFEYPFADRISRETILGELGYEEGRVAYADGCSEALLGHKPVIGEIMPGEDVDPGIMVIPRFFAGTVESVQQILNRLRAKSREAEAEARDIPGLA